VGIGGLGDSRARVERDEEAPQLTIEGVAFFGGFGVTSELPEAAARELDEAVARSNGRKHPAETDDTQVVATV
jgi:hypothetical protein